MCKLLSIFGLLLLAVSYIRSDDIIVIPGDELEGPNVCKRIEDYTIEVVTAEQEPYQKKVNSWCWNIPPRCEKYKIDIKVINKTSTLHKSRLIKECCAGYTKHENNKKCIPVCEKPCNHGTCVEPNVCKCDAGYGGPACDINCPPKMWGKECQNKCNCKNDATCDPYDGTCRCTKGFLGKKCEKSCPEGFYGENCSETCRCENYGKCDHVSGECKCASGWVGPLCQDQCPEGKHGEKCQSECRCQNGGICDSITGKCRCPPGWTGTVCANRCHGGYFGKNCSEICECFNGADCHHINGSCTCAPGFQGLTCLDTCPYNKFGQNCQETCQCKNGAKCDGATGKCECKPGWKGKDCSERICEEHDKYGENCTQTCQCDFSNTEMCHPWTGKCDCFAGWSSEDCSRPCSLLTYGKHCKQNCDCKNSAQCSPINGTCICSPGYRGEKCEQTCPEGFYGQDCSQKCECLNGAKCAPETGQCFCAPGFQGFTCNRPCDLNRYGENCLEKCNCTSNGVCDPKNGECSCAPGYKGKKCEEKCDNGYFGYNCSQVCDCDRNNSHQCDPITGKCICKMEWGGVRCSSQCSVGFYGEQCDNQCNCKNNSSCDPITGDCVCERGWMGIDCSKPCPKGYYGNGCREKCPDDNMMSNKTCDHVTGEYKCRPGYIGLTCQHPCPFDTYGPDCSFKCDCKNGGECSHINGQCTCSPGWTGSSCNEVCPDGTYGNNCTQLCKCRNGTKCRKNDGMCICELGYMGYRCEELCTPGFYGHNCMSVCDCPNDNFVCHAAQGCVCRSGLTGPYCNELLADQRIGEIPEANNSNSQVDGQYLKSQNDTKGVGIIFKVETSTFSVFEVTVTNKPLIIVKSEIEKNGNFTNDTKINQNSESTMAPHLVERVDEIKLKVDAEKKIEKEGKKKKKKKGSNNSSGSGSEENSREVHSAEDNSNESASLENNEDDENFITTLTTKMGNSGSKSQVSTTSEITTTISKDLNVAGTEKPTETSTKPDSQYLGTLTISQENKETTKPIAEYGNSTVRISLATETTTVSGGLEIMGTERLMETSTNPGYIIKASTTSASEISEINNQVSSTSEITTTISKDLQVSGKENSHETSETSEPTTEPYTPFTFAHLDRNETNFITSPSTTISQAENGSEVNLKTYKSSEITTEISKKIIASLEESVTGGFEPTATQILSSSETTNNYPFETIETLNIVTQTQDVSTSSESTSGSSTNSDNSDTRTTQESGRNSGQTEVNTEGSLSFEPTLGFTNINSTGINTEITTSSNPISIETTRVSNSQEMGMTQVSTEAESTTQIDGILRTETSNVESNNSTKSLNTSDDELNHLNLHIPSFGHLNVSSREMGTILHYILRPKFNEIDSNVNPSTTDKLIGTHQEINPEKVSNAGVVWGVIGSIVFLAIIILLLLYYRRRVANLKAEINHVVKYMSDAPGNFDNPVYSFPPPTINTDTSTLLDHNYMNNFRRARPNNLDHLNNFNDDSNVSTRAGTYSVDYNQDMSEKNLQADLTNPNLYHCIDEKDYHVYDEIKNKDGYKENDVEYDHLDYSRPTASYKPHYHRMTQDSMCSNASTVLMDSLQPPTTSSSINKFEEKENNSITPPPKQLNISVPPLPEKMKMKMHSPASSTSSTASSTATQDDNIDKFDVDKPVDKILDNKELEIKTSED